MRFGNWRGAAATLALGCILASTASANDFGHKSIPDLTPAMDLNTGQQYYAPPIPYGHYVGKGTGAKALGALCAPFGAVKGKVGGLLHHGDKGCKNCGGAGCGLCGGGHGGEAGGGHFGGHHGGGACGDPGCGTRGDGGPLGGGHFGGGLGLGHGNGHGGQVFEGGGTIYTSGGQVCAPGMPCASIPATASGQATAGVSSTMIEGGSFSSCGGCKGKGCGLCGGKGGFFHKGLGLGHGGSGGPCGDPGCGSCGKGGLFGHGGGGGGIGACSSCGGKGCGLCGGKGACHACGGKGCGLCRKAAGVLGAVKGKAYGLLHPHAGEIEYFVGPGGPVPITPGYVPYVVPTRSPRDFFAFPPYTDQAR